MLSNFFIFILGRNLTKKRKIEVQPTELPEVPEDEGIDLPDNGIEKEDAGGLSDGYKAPDRAVVWIEMTLEANLRSGEGVVYDNLLQNINELPVVPIIADSNCNCKDFGITSYLL